MQGKLLKAKLAEKEMNAKTLCEMIGMPISTWQTRVSGQSEFRCGEVAKIADVLHLSNGELFNIFFAGDVQ